MSQLILYQCETAKMSAASVACNCAEAIASNGSDRGLVADGRARVGNQPAFYLCDGGCDRATMYQPYAEKVAKKLGLPMREYEEAITATLADGSTTRITKYLLADLKLETDRYETSVEKQWSKQEVSDRWQMAVRRKLLLGEVGWMTARQRHQNQSQRTNQNRNKNKISLSHAHQKKCIWARKMESKARRRLWDLSRGPEMCKTY